MTAILRTSERKDFKRCPQKWWWLWREGLRPNAPPSNPLWFGTGIHVCLEKWYIPGKTRGVHPAETWEEWSDGEVRFFRENYGDTFDDAKYTDMNALGKNMMEGYVKRYGNDDAWEVLAPEWSTEVSVPRTWFEKTVDGQWNCYATYGLSLDTVYRDHADGGRPKILENKTAASISTRHLSLDPQATSYLALAQSAMRADGLIGAAEKIDTITYNFLRKGKEDDRPKNAQGHALNKDGTPSKRQPPDNFVRHTEKKTRTQLMHQVEAIQDELFMMDGMRDGYLPLYKVQVDMGPTACTGCPVFALCEVHDIGGDVEEFKQIAYHIEDPYQAHRKDAEVEE